MIKDKSIYDELGEERKQLQEEGLVPEWCTTAAWQMLKENYLNDTTKDLKSLYSRVSKHAAKHTDDPVEWESKFFDLFWKGWLAGSTPVLSNMGTGKGCAVSCSGQTIEDSVFSFYDNQKEAAILSKNGFGTSGYLGKIRPRGSKISGIKGFASGVLPVFKDFVQMSRDISQGCYDKHTELLTERGWMLFDDLIAEKNSGNLIKVAQVNDDDIIEFVYPTDYIKYKFEGNLISFYDTKNINLFVTPNHNMVSCNRRRLTNKRDLETRKYLSHEKYVVPKLNLERADTVNLHRDKYFKHSSFLSDGDGLSILDRLKIAYQADGVKNGTHIDGYSFRFKKERKINRLEWILNELGLDYSKNKDVTGVTTLYIKKSELILHETLDWIDISSINLTWASEFIDEILQWDGDQIRRYSSIIEMNVDVIQSIAVMCGYKCRKNVRIRDFPRQTLYSLDLAFEEYFGTESIRKSKLFYNDNVFCVTVPSNKIIIRSNDHTLVCGNSQRRGAWAGYIEIDHPDFFELVNFISKNPDDANIGWNITDNFIERLDSGDIDAIDRYQKALKLKMITGKGYFLFIDKVNRQNPKMYKDLGLDVKASNLCLTGDTRIKILGDVSGIIEVSMSGLNNYTGKNDEVENWKIWSYNIETGVSEWKKILKSAQTAKNAKLIKITDKLTGKFIKCTPSHLVFTKTRGYIEAKDLLESDVLLLN